MKKPILPLIFILAALATISAQNAPEDSIRILFREIINAPTDSRCKTFGNYRDAIKEISLENPEDAISRVIFEDSLFLKDKNNKNCPLIKPITHLQAILHKLKYETATDTSSLIQALLYAKSKFSGYVNVQLKFNPASNPLISIQSLDGFILPVQADSSTADVYLLREKPYRITVSLSGYDLFTTQVISTNDSIIAVDLHKIKTTSEAEDHEIQNKPTISPLWWWIPIALILGMLISLVIRNRKTDRSPNNDLQVSGGKNDDAVRRLNDKLKNQEVLINKYVNEIEGLKSKETVHPLKPSSGKYFLTEMMMTAGPRKKMNVDRDLGEDVCGFIMKGNEALMWLLDGSSDFFDPLLNPENKREYFSSRLLAQSLGRKLRNLITLEKAASLETVVDNITKEVKEDWLLNINSLPETEKNILRKNLKDGIQPDCAATVLIARLTVDGDLKICRTGDSKLLSFIGKAGKIDVDTALASKNDKIGPVSFLMNLDQNNFDIIIRKSKPEITERTNVLSVIGYSDGIGKATEKTLIEDYPVDAEKARNEIISQLQGTSDDKSMFIIEIKES